MFLPVVQTKVRGRQAFATGFSIHLAHTKRRRCFPSRTRLHPVSTTSRQETHIHVRARGTEMHRNRSNNPLTLALNDHNHLAQIMARRVVAAQELPCWGQEGQAPHLVHLRCIDLTTILRHPRFRQPPSPRLQSCGRKKTHDQLQPAQHIPSGDLQLRPSPLQKTTQLQKLLSLILRLVSHT